MKNSKLVFTHLGYGKSGSSTLQSYLFPKHPDIFYYGIDLSKSIKNHEINVKSNADLFLTKTSKKLTNILTNLDRYKGVDNDIKKNIRKDINKAAENKKIFVFSNENFSETPSAYLMAQVLKEYIPESNILLVLRNQFDLIQSLYNYTCHSLRHVPKPYKHGYVSFNNWFNNCKINENNRGSHKAWDRQNDYIRIIDFHHIIECLEVFFPKKIHVVLYEDLKSNNKDFYKKLSKILQIDDSKLSSNLLSHKTNISANQTLVKYAGLLRRLPYGKEFLNSDYIRDKKLFKFIRNYLRNYGYNVKMNTETLQYITNRYKEGNRIIAKKYKLPLEQYGYPY